MDLRQLRQFVVLGETGNFHRAAEQLHIAQPPLSVSIRKLEDEFGCALFVRHSKGVRLTQSGLAAISEARKSLAHAELALLNARAVAQGTGGNLRIGFVGSATYTLLPRLVPAFRKAYPAVDLVFTESTSIEVLRRLDDRELDIGLVRYPVLESTSRSLLPLERHPFVAAVAAGSPFAARTRIALAALADQPFIAHSAREVPNLHSIFMLLCQEAGFVPRIVQEAVQVQTIVSLVESGLGIALVPRAAARYANKQVRFIPLRLKRHSLDTGIALVSQEESSGPTARNFTDIAKKLTARAEIRGPNVGD